MEKCIDSEEYKKMTAALQLVQETAPAEDGLHLYLGKDPETGDYQFIRFFYSEGAWRSHEKYEEVLIKSVSNSPVKQEDT